MKIKNPKSEEPIDKRQTAKYYVQYKWLIFFIDKNN